MSEIKKVTKHEYFAAAYDIVLDPKVHASIRKNALEHMFCFASELTKYTDVRLSKPGKDLPVPVMKELVGLVYHAVLKKMGKDDPHTRGVFNAAIQHLGEHELKLEWEAICDGTVSNIVETMMNFDKQPHHVQQDIANIFEGLAKPYFVDYKGKVPKEDLEWAHKEIRDYFANLKKQEPALTGKSDEDKPKLGPARLRLSGK